MAKQLNKNDSQDKKIENMKMRLSAETLDFCHYT